jgi:hypothetical protein
MTLGLILSLFDASGVWSEPYREAGYEVEQIDLSLGRDVRLLELPSCRVHGILSAPPCTVFANSGARWERTDEELAQALSLVDAVFRLVHVCRPTWWVLENPVGKLPRWIGLPRMSFDPCDYGDPYTKRTCLWGEFSEPRKLLRTAVAPVEGSKMHRLPPGPERTALRSTTPPGFARAFYESNP